MSTITTRAGKGSPLTNSEVDANFTNLNTDKAELSGAAFTGNITFTDNSKAIFGAGSDLQIYHDGLNSYIVDAGTGDLYFRSASNLYIGNAAGTQSYITAADGGAVDLRYNGASKLATTSTGIDVNGTITAYGLNFDVSDGVEINALESIIFDIDSDNNQTGRVFQVKANNSTPLFTIQEAGNVGIGTTTPSNDFHVSSTSGTKALFEKTGSTGAYIGLKDSSGSLVYLGDNNGTFEVQTAGSSYSTKLAVTSAGNVGIGTSSPSSQLEVQDANGVSLKFGDLSSYPNNVVPCFIGTATSALAGVNGDLVLCPRTSDAGKILFATGSGQAAERFRIAADGSLSTPTAGTSNVRFGVNAGNSIASGGTRNVLIGDQAGTAITTGDYNVALGYAALDAEDAGSRATALGYFALSNQNTDTDSYNVAVGFSAGEAVTTGVQNTLIGALAGDAMTTAGGNTALGYQAMSALTTGGGNTALGHQSMANGVVTGLYNTAVGDSSLKYLSSGAYNTATGWNALVDNTTGSQNTASGAQALTANTTGSHNTAFGRDAGLLNTTGYDNTYVGSRAGRLTTTGVENTAVGAHSLYVATGNFNTATGRYTLHNCTGTSNSAFGHQAGINLTNGNYNAFVGKDAGSGCTSGESNVAIGFRSLHTSNTANKNIAIGDSALRAFSGSGDGNNTAVGHSALTALTTGSQNVAVGANAADALQAASDNTAVGYDALTKETGGQNNVAVGTRALQNQVNGAGNIYNTAVGSNAGRYITSGSGNTTVGGNSLDALTAGNNNTALGLNAGTSMTNASGNTYIGYHAGYSNAGSGVYNNTFVGYSAGAAITSGYKNTIIGAFQGNSGGLDIRTSSNNIVLSDGDGNPRGIFDGTGNYLIGLTSISDATSRTYGNAFAGSGSNPNWKSWGSGSHTHAQFRNGTSAVGSITTTSSATAYNTSSDHRLKENVVAMTGATERLKQLAPKRFNFIADADTTVDGFLAHEVQTVVPEAISGTHNEVDDDGNAVYQGIDQSKLVPLLVATIQELEARIAALESN